VAAARAYNERAARVEDQVNARLRDRLGAARNANEMFRVFSKSNAYSRRCGDCLLLDCRFVKLFKNTRRSLSILSRRISNVCKVRA
jgi:hypothetical protein